MGGIIGKKIPEWGRIPLPQIGPRIMQAIKDGDETMVKQLVTRAKKEGIWIKGVAISRQEGLAALAISEGQLADPPNLSIANFLLDEKGNKIKVVNIMHTDSEIGFTLVRLEKMPNNGKKTGTIYDPE